MIHAEHCRKEDCAQTDDLGPQPMPPEHLVKLLYIRGMRLYMTRRRKAHRADDTQWHGKEHNCLCQLSNTKDWRMTACRSRQR